MCVFSHAGGMVLGNHVWVVLDVVERGVVFFDNRGCLFAVGYLEATARCYFSCAVTYRRGTRLDGEPRLRGIARPITSMRAAIGVGSGTTVAGFGGDGAVAGFHVGTTIAFISADTAEAGRAGGGVATGSVCQGRGAFQLAEDGFLVGEEIANEAVGVALVHGEGCVCTRAENAGGKGLGERGGVLFCC